MTCPSCDAAEADPINTGMYHAGCLECTARALARSPMAARASSGDPGELQQAMLLAFPSDYRAGRVAVWRWLELVKVAKERRVP